MTATYTATTRRTLLPNVLYYKKVEGYYSAPSNTDVEKGGLLEVYPHAFK
jgi:hypothetical protein